MSKQEPWPQKVIRETYAALSDMLPRYAIFAPKLHCVDRGTRINVLLSDGRVGHVSMKPTWRGGELILVADIQEPH